MTTPDNVYYNAVFTGPDDFGNEGSSPAEFSVNRDIPIIDKCSDYYVSIIRFAIPLDNVPILVMPVIPNQDNNLAIPPQNATPFVIGISYTDGGGVVHYFVQNLAGKTYPNNIVWVPPSVSQTGGPTKPVYQVPFSPVPINAQIITPYYFEYSYTHFINMINEALANAYVLFRAAFPAIPQTADPNPPYFVYDPESQLMALIIPRVWATTQAQEVQNPPNVARVSFNDELYTQIDGFNFIFPSAVTNPLNDDAQIVVRDYGINQYPTPGLPETPISVYPIITNYFLKVEQDFNVVNYISSLRKVIITTGTIPIVNEVVPSGDSNTSVAASLPIITDFVVNLETAGQSRNTVYYNPTAQYRLVDMQSDSPLQKIDLRIYWSDKNSNLYPIMISKFSQASVKLGFFKKSIYKKMFNAQQGGNERAMVLPYRMRDY